MQIISYVPYKDSIRKTYRIVNNIAKLAIVLLAIWGIFVTRQHYVLRCSAGGMFMTQAKCDTFANAQFYEQELGRIEFMQNNSDIFGDIKEADAAGITQ